MNNVMNLRNALYLLLVPMSSGTKLMHALIGRMAVAGPVYVLDGGPFLDLKKIQFSSHRFSLDAEAMRLRITPIRYQSFAGLENLLMDFRPQQTVFVLGLAETLCGEDLSGLDRLDHLQSLAGIFQNIAQRAPVVVSADPGVFARYAADFEHLSRIAHQVWRFQLPALLQPPVHSLRRTACPRTP